jgi:hypothetical protein
MIPFIITFFNDGRVIVEYLFIEYWLFILLNKIIMIMFGLMFDDIILYIIVIELQLFDLIDMASLLVEIRNCVGLFLTLNPLFQEEVNLLVVNVVIFQQLTNQSILLHFHKLLLLLLPISIVYAIIHVVIIIILMHYPSLLCSLHSLCNLALLILTQYSSLLLNFLLLLHILL